jgi:hypothetical protein
MNKRQFLIFAAKSAFRLGVIVTLPHVTECQAINRRNEMSDVNETVVRYLAAWNEPDAKRRRDLVAKAWADDGTYVDAAREGRGHDSISTIIGVAQEHFPGYRLHLASGIEAHHDHVRFSWVAGGTMDAPLYIKGTDFGVLAPDGRLKSVVGFIDAAPFPAARQ